MNRFNGPEFPDKAVPVLIRIAPDTPAEMAFAEKIETCPDDPCAADPLMRTNDPPVLEAAVVPPACKMTGDPGAVFEEPTVSETEPAAPDVASPELIITYPEPPESLLPLRKLTPPLDPTPVTAPLLSIKAPVLPICAVPVTTERAPELPSDEEYPVVRKSAPELPRRVVPEPTTTFPELPLLTDSPEASVTAPVEPERVDPDKI